MMTKHLHDDLKKVILLVILLDTTTPFLIFSWFDYGQNAEKWVLAGHSHLGIDVRMSA